jgi:hypothetical protein
MIRTLLTIAGFLALIALAYYVFVVVPNRNKPKEGDACKTPDNLDGTIQGGVCVSGRPQGNNPPPPIAQEIPLNPGLGIHSLQVNESDASAGSLAFTGLAESNLAVFNILGAAVAVKPFIHFTTNFSNTCPQYVWYSKALYRYIGTVTNTSGIKTCYYKFDKAIFPSELKVMVSALPCSAFKYYLSGVEYAYSGSETKQGLNYCIYKKQ